MTQIRENLLENSYLSCNEQLFKLVNVSNENLNKSRLYFLHSKISGRYFIGRPIVFNRYLLGFDKMTIKNGEINNEKLPDYFHIHASFKNLYHDIYVAELNGSYLNDLGPKCKIINSKQNWREYHEELNEDSNANYPIKKISHLREIVDLIGSFL